jgi:hypothetical protein
MLYLLGNNKNMNIQDVIKWLQTNEVDGETMENIIREVGMEDQMLRQLVMKANSSDVYDLLSEKIRLQFDDIVQLEIGK